MKLSSIAAGLTAAASALGSAAAAPVSALSASLADIDSTCGFRATYQIISYLNTGSVDKGDSMCIAGSEGAGYTAGLARFSTQYGSVLNVVKLYKADSTYKGEFDALLPTLEKYAAQQSGALAGLEKFCDAWAKAATNRNAFRGVQLTAVRTLYDVPLRDYISNLGIEYPLTKTAIIDTLLLNGYGDTKDGLGAIVSATNAAFTADASGDSESMLSVGSAKVKVDEIVWLSKFLDTRDRLSNGRDSSHSDPLRSLIKSQTYTLNGTFTFTGFGDKPISIGCNKLL
ncbi:hypothetical protein H4R19_005030 [Coemansia spiralis]|nr:hypothetical protein H4R19_005030 [Coemansia spiralis]